MDSRNEVYRAVNEYMDYHTGETRVEYSKVYHTPGPAKAYATSMRHVNGKGSRLKQIPNNNGTFFEFRQTWCERAEHWVSI